MSFGLHSESQALVKKGSLSSDKHFSTKVYIKIKIVGVFGGTEPLQDLQA